MTRYRPEVVLPLDPEIERTSHKLRKIFTQKLQERSKMAINFQEQTLKELANSEVNNQPLCFQLPQLEEGVAGFELKSNIIHLLPKFHDLVGEDPYKHLMEFHVVLETMGPHGCLEDYMKMKAFSFTLMDAAKDWLYWQPNPMTTWLEMKRRFLEKYFPASRTASIRKDISGIRQANGESLYEYWERFQKLCASCPNHQIADQLLIQYFYEGLSPYERNMLDAASGGALMDKTPDAARWS